MKGLALFLGVLACLPLWAAELRHEEASNWPALAEGRALGICAGVGVDSANRVLVFHRDSRVWKTPFPTEPISATTVWVLDGKTGGLTEEWGAGQFVMPHGLTVDGDDHVWLTDVGQHQVFKFTRNGKLLLTLGERGMAGADATHFNLPTDVAVLADGSFYVSDGYKNTRVVKFDAAGRYLYEWGGKGGGTGEFNLPHGLALGEGGRVYVCDRENLRMQVFDAQGKFLNQWPGPQIGKPYGVDVAADGHVFIIDGGTPSVKRNERGKVVELDGAGKVIDTFGVGLFELGHDIAVGPDGAVYVAEATGRRVRKFVQRPPNR